MCVRTVSNCVPVCVSTVVLVLHEYKGGWELLLVLVYLCVCVCHRSWGGGGDGS